MIDIALNKDQWMELKRVLKPSIGEPYDGDYQKRGHLTSWKKYFKDHGATYEEHAKQSSKYYWGKVSFRTEKQQVFFILSNPELHFLFDENFKIGEY